MSTLDGAATLWQAKACPVRVVPWAEADITDPGMRARVLRAIRRAKPGFTLADVDAKVHEFRLQLYEEKLKALNQVLGIPFVQWQAHRRACEALGVEFPDANRAPPQERHEPGDLAYSTLWWAEDAKKTAAHEAKMEQVTAQMAKIMAKRSQAASAQPPPPPPPPATVTAKAGSGFKRIKRPRSAPKGHLPPTTAYSATKGTARTAAAFTPAQVEVRSASLSAHAAALVQNKATSEHALVPAAAPAKARTVEPAAEAAVNAATLAESSGSDMERIWEKYVPQDCLLPTWPKLPGFPHEQCGVFDIPFPPQRDWDACVGDQEECSVYLRAPVILDWQVIGNGCRKVVVRMKPDHAKNISNEVDVWFCWYAVLKWVTRLLDEERDLPLVEALQQFIYEGTGPATFMAEWPRR